MKSKNYDVLSELKEIKKKENILKKELDYVKDKEREILVKLNKGKINEKNLERRAYKNIMHFTFSDFAQTTIGACVFSFAPFLDTDPWNFIPFVNLKLLVYIHIFFIFCVFIAINYKFRTNFKFDWWFIKLLLKRLFYTYFSVFMVMILILVLINKLAYELVLVDVIKNFLTVQTIGLFGAVTFSFLKKD